MKKIFLPLLVPALLSVSACTPSNDSETKVSDTDTLATAQETTNFDSVYNSISDADIREPLKILSSDEFEGRLPTTEGEKKTIDYLVSQFKEAGLEPGNGDSY